MTPEDESGLGRARPGRLVILYDGACGTCRGALGWLLRDADSIDAVDLNGTEAARRFPALKRDELTRQLHAIDDRGRVFVGAQALERALRYQAGWPRYLAGWWLIPGFGALAQVLYRAFAATRHRDPNS